MMDDQVVLFPLTGFQSYQNDRSAMTPSLGWTIFASGRIQTHDYSCDISWDSKLYTWPHGYFANIKVETGW